MVYLFICLSDLDDRIFYCLLASMAALQADDIHAFPVCGLFEWPSSGVVGFYHHQPSWSCRLRNCLRLRSVRCTKPMHVVELFTS